MSKRGDRWTLTPLEKRQLRLKPLTESENDSLAASPGEVENRPLREMGVYALEYLARKKISDRVLKLPDTPFFFSDIQIRGNDVPRMCSNARIVEPAREACHCRWAKVQWKTTDVYPYFLSAVTTKRVVDIIIKSLPDTAARIDMTKIPAKYHGILTAISKTDEVLLDDCLVRLLR